MTPESRTVQRLQDAQAVMTDFQLSESHRQMKELVVSGGADSLHESVRNAP